MGNGAAKRFRGKWWFGDDPCVYCGNRATTKDHIQPVSRGGKDHWTNYAPCCRICNSSRGNRPLLVWLIVLDLKRRGREKAHQWQSKSLLFKKADERTMKLSVEHWKLAKADRSPEAPHEPS